jgi:hypothetical protein
MRFAVIGVLILAALIGVVIFYFTNLYAAPTCQDGKRNQEEQGIDCGGPCSAVCTATAAAPTTIFTSLIRNKTGRVDLVASVENKNGEAGAKNIPFRVTLYSATGDVVRELPGSLDLPPHTIVPIFIPGVAADGEGIVRAFLKVEASSPRWVAMPTDPRNLLKVAVAPVGGVPEAPRVSALLTNSSLVPILNLPVVVFLRDSSSGNVIAASRTVVSRIDPQESATAIFTWNEPFATSSVRVEVTPVVPLP